MGTVNRADLTEWLRRQYAVDETQIYGALYVHRTGSGDAVDASDLERIAAERARLESMSDDELRGAAARYADREGYREEWRP